MENFKLSLYELNSKFVVDIYRHIVNLPEFKTVIADNIRQCKRSAGGLENEADVVAALKQMMELPEGIEAKSIEDVFSLYEADAENGKRLFLLYQETYCRISCLKERRRRLKSLGGVRNYFISWRKGRLMKKLWQEPFTVKDVLDMNVFFEKQKQTGTV